MEWGLQGPLRLAVWIPGHILTPDPLDLVLTIEPVAGFLHFLKERVPSVREEGAWLCEGSCSLFVEPADISVFSIFSLPFLLGLSQPVPSVGSLAASSSYALL